MKIKIIWYFDNGSKLHSYLYTDDVEAKSVADALFNFKNSTINYKPRTIKEVFVKVPFETIKT